MKVIRIEEFNPKSGEWKGISFSLGFYMGKIKLEGGSEVFHRVYDSKNIKPFELSAYHAKFFFTKLGYKKFGQKLAKEAIKRGLEIRFLTREVTKENYIAHNKHQVILEAKEV